MLVNHGKLWISWFAVVIHDVMPETRKCASWIFVCFYRVAIPLEEEIIVESRGGTCSKKCRHVEMSAHSWLDVWLPLADFGVSTAFQKLSKCNNDYSCLYISTVSTLGRLLSTFYHVAVFTDIDIDSIDIPKNDETSQASWNLAAPRLHGYDPKELGLLQGAVPGGSPVRWTLVALHRKQTLWKDGRILWAARLQGGATAIPARQAQNEGKCEENLGRIWKNMKNIMVLLCSCL